MHEPPALCRRFLRFEDRRDETRRLVRPKYFCRSIWPTFGSECGSGDRPGLQNRWNVVHRRSVGSIPIHSRSAATADATDLRGYFCHPATGNKIATLTPTARVCILAV
jgi:hypothetical protein